ncbi:MAG: ABC transporter substrate-binding protein [Gammaproteobacteria bacterium]|nr:toluene tolerance protein [Gammaproteobacteria bacterium]
MIARYLFSAWLAALLAVGAAALAQDERPSSEAPESEVGAEQLSSAERTVERFHEALVRVAAEHGDEPVAVRYDALLPVVTETHDLPYIAEVTLRREWRDLGDDERERFVDAFVRLSVATYASRFGQLGPGMFSLDGAEPLPGGRVQVGATLRTREGRTIPFEYVLHETDAGWKIVNILADNVSDLALKRAEYRRILDAGSIDDVIAELERQAAEQLDGA